MPFGRRLRRHQLPVPNQKERPPIRVVFPFGGGGGNRFSAEMAQATFSCRKRQFTLSHGGCDVPPARRQEPPFDSPLYNVRDHPGGIVSYVGGGGGNRTPVRKHFHGNFSGRRQSFTFPRSGVG